MPLPVRSNYDYVVPEHLEKKIVVGARVLVVFGKSKIYTGVVKRLHASTHDTNINRLKALDDLLDDEPALQPRQLQLFEWIAFYYFCTEGEVVKAALPAGLKPESNLIVEPWVDEWDSHELTDREIDLMELLRVKPSATLQEVSDLWGIQSPTAYLKNMAVRGLIRMVQRVEEAYKPKTEKYIEMADEWRSEDALQLAFDSLRNAARQEEALMLIVAEFFQKRPIAKAELKKRLNGGESAVKGLLEKGIVREFEVEVDRVESFEYREMNRDIVLNPEQEAALAKMKASFAEHPGKPVLLHGVTGSGKTHLYIHLIREALAQGKEALYLLPEIALTQQIIDKVKSEFGEKVGVYHSRFSDNERVEIWRKVTRGEYKVVIGVRSAIFLPFKDLGLFVVDEEHDHSFKQAEPNPRYHARDLAAYAARLWNAQIVLGSATPSFETYYNALHGRYTLVELKNRATTATLPEINLVDMRIQRKDKLLQGHFSQPMLEGIRQTLLKGEQVILFQNRRGFVPWLACTHCGNVPKCINCDISLVYHKAKKHLRCHYCGYTDYETEKCEVCGQYDLKMTGLGTERVEEELKEILPEARIERMDADTTRTRTAFIDIIRKLERKEIDILVGTQMVSKGLDFENVTLVGVLEADNILNFSDFRAFEQGYQLLTQVSGRAGRSTRKGRVFIQTYMPDSYVLQLLQKDYRLFYERELSIREICHYPPFTRLIRMELRHKNQMFLESQAVSLRNLLTPVFGGAMLGPEYPQVTRLRGEYRQQILFKIGRTTDTRAVRKILYEKMDAYYRDAPQKTLRIVVDVDPY